MTRELTDALEKFELILSRLPFTPCEMSSSERTFRMRHPVDLDRQIDYEYLVIELGDELPTLWRHSSGLNISYCANLLARKGLSEHFILDTCSALSQGKLLNSSSENG